MLAKVPEKRKDGKSNFATLVAYVSRQDEKEKPEDELRTRQAEHFGRIFDEIADNLRESEKYLSEITATHYFDREAIRINIRSLADAISSNSKRNGDSERNNTDSTAVESGLTKYELSRDHRTKFASIRQNLNAADYYLELAGRVDRNFQRRARAYRADVRRSIGAFSYRGGPDAREFEFDRSRERVNGVAIQHNGLSFETIADEMQSVADMNVRVKDPVYHVIISWQADEKPTDDQMFDSALHAMKSLGMEGHQYLAAIHRDTNNPHLHLTVNRVHPDTFEAVYPHRDFFKLDYAMRELELKFGFKHDNGPYSVFEVGGETFIDWTEKEKKKKKKQPQKAKDMEAHTDFESFYTFLKKEVRPELVKLFKSKVTWKDLHNFLAKYNVAIREKGQGFAIYSLGEVQTTPIKASSLHEGMSKSRLEARLGPFIQASTTDAQPDNKRTYDKEKSDLKRDPELRQKRKLERAAARKKLYEEYDQYKKLNKVFVNESSESIKQRFAEITRNAKFERNGIKESQPNAALRKAMYSIVALQTLQKKEALKRQITKEKEERKKHNEKLFTFRQWVEKKAAEGDAAAISQLRGWRYKEQQANKGLNGISGQDGDPGKPTILENSKYKVLRNGNIQYLKNKQVAFIDNGQQITVTERFKEDKSVLNEVLSLGRKRFGDNLVFSGSKEFQDLMDKESKSLKASISEVKKRPTQ